MKKIILLPLIFIIRLGISQPNANLKLWYDKPAGDTWENALPIGNGRLGAMIYGNTNSETIQLNEHTVWSGSPNRNDNPESLIKLDSIRLLIFEKKYKEAEALANRAIITKKSHGQKFQPVGNLHLVFDGHDKFTNYYRELNISRAVNITKYTVNNITYTRETFASLSDRIIIMKIAADKPGKISFNAYYRSPHLKKAMVTTSAQDLILSGITSTHETAEGKIKFMT